MTVPSYTEEDVELVARVLNGKALFDEPAAGSIYLDPLRESYREQARAILAALSSANRLVPPGSEVREEFGVRWPDSPTVWSYDDRDEAEEYAGDTIEGQNPGEINRRLHIVTPWSPSVPDTEERDDA